MFILNGIFFRVFATFNPVTYCYFLFFAGLHCIQESAVPAHTTVPQGSCAYRAMSAAINLAPDSLPVSPVLMRWLPMDAAPSTPSNAVSCNHLWRVFCGRFLLSFDCSCIIWDLFLVESSSSSSSSSLLSSSFHHCRLIKTNIWHI